MDFYVNKLIEMAVPAAVAVISVLLGCGAARLFFRKKLLVGRILAYTLLIIYLFILLVTVLLDRQSGFVASRINLIPLNDLRSDLVRQERALLMLAVNTLLFVPWGILLPVLFTPFRKFRWILAAGLGLSLTLEAVQYFGKMGIFETDDLIFNTLGTILGFLLYKMCGILFHSKSLKNEER